MAAESQNIVTTTASFAGRATSIAAGRTVLTLDVLHATSPPPLPPTAGTALATDDALQLYKYDLLNAFSRFHFSLDADMETYFALVLTPRPRLAEVE